MHPLYALFVIWVYLKVCSKSFNGSCSCFVVSFYTSAGGLPCKLEGIIASPIVNGYRNKCEFSVGYSLGGKVTVGFMLGNFR